MNASDMPINGWVTRFLPDVLIPYAQILRLDRPIGTWLVLYPCLWGTALASEGAPDPFLVLMFALGALLMRGAGCAYNDWVDQDFDGKVARTATRPLPSGRLTKKNVLALLAGVLTISLGILLTFPPLTIGLGIASLGLVALYPFAKRFTYWPQVFLGLAFNWGALMGWAAVRESLEMAIFFVYAAGIFWTLFYDTLYAHQDKEDDLLVGLKSTALLLGARTKPFLLVFMLCMLGCLLQAGNLLALRWPYYAGIAAAALHLLWQIKLLDLEDPKVCLHMFKLNRWIGLILLSGIVAARLLPE